MSNSCLLTSLAEVLELKFLNLFCISRFPVDIKTKAFSITTISKNISPCIFTLSITIAVLCQLCSLFYIFSSGTAGEGNASLSCQQNRQTTTCNFAPQGFIFCMHSDRRTLKGKNLLIVVDAHNHQGDFSSYDRYKNTCTADRNKRQRNKNNK